MLDLITSESMAWNLRTALGLSFLLYGLAKLRDLPGFVAGAVLWDVLDPALVRPLATLLPLVEVAIGAALLLGRAVLLASIGALLTLGVFAVAVLVNLFRGKRVPCFCTGPATEEQIGVATLLRIAVLGSFAYVVTTHPATSSILPPSGPVAIFSWSILVSTLTLLAFLPPLEVAVREWIAVRNDRRAARSADGAVSQTSISSQGG